MSTLDPAFEQETLSATPLGTGWRVVAVLGVLIALLIAAVESFPLEPRQGRLFVFAVPLLIATLLVLRIGFPWPWARIWSQPDLLVPVGVVVGADQLLGLLHKLPLLAALLTPQWTARLLGLSLGLSVGIVVNMALWTAFAAWQTDLLWRAMRGESPLNLSPWPSLQRYFLRAFLALAVGMGVLLLGLIPILAIGAVLFVVAIPAMGVFGVVWNLATAALLPVTLFSSRPLGASLAGGLRVSWDMKGRWWRGLLAQLLLLGLIIVLRVHFTRSAAELQGMGRGQMGMHTQTSVKWHVNAFWVGGYEHSCRWYTKYAEALETSPVPLVGEGLGLVFLVLAVAMKLTVLGELSGAADAVFGEKPLTAVPPPLPVVAPPVPPW